MIGIPWSVTKIVKKHEIDDAIDRLNYYVAPFTLLFISVMVAAKQYFGSPIQCWGEAQFSHQWFQYMEDYCFIEGTYHSSDGLPLPKDSSEMKKNTLAYYQWVPFMLAVQALFFSLPNIFFLWTTTFNSVEMNSVVQSAKSLRGIDRRKRRVGTTEMAITLSKALEFGEVAADGNRFLCLNGLFGSVTLWYLLTKIAYTLNIFGQIFMISRFLNINDYFWGWNHIGSFANEDQWSMTSVFPRVTWCKFQVRGKELGQKFEKFYDTRCVLMQNMINEKVYIVMWFFLVAIAFFTVVSLLFTVYRMFLGRERRVRCWLKDYLDTVTCDDTVTHNIDHTVTSFVQRALKFDGLLVLRFINFHAGPMVAREVAVELYKMHNIYQADIHLTENPFDNKIDADDYEWNDLHGDAILMQPLVDIHVENEVDSLESQETNVDEEEEKETKKET